MGEFVGLDVSLKETAVSVRRAGKRVWRGKCPSDPTLLAELIRKRAPMSNGWCSNRAAVSLLLS
jgi:transposase